MTRLAGLGILPFIALILLAAGCTTTRAPELYLSHFELKSPSINDFETCSSAGCRKRSKLAFTPEEWGTIQSLFEPAPVDAATEREQIRTAIALMETYIGEKNGTKYDQAKNQRNNSLGPQLDCIAEAANTTVGLMLLEKEQLLNFHRTSYPHHRGFSRLRLPHNTASVVELQSGTTYAIDSWFHANGTKPECVLVSDWKAGYNPE